MEGKSKAMAYDGAMVRPDRAAGIGGSCCIELAGESPVAASAGAPRSRPRAWEEILPPEWGVKSPRSVVWPVGGEQVRRPSIKRTLQPRDINTRKDGKAEPLMPRRRQQTASRTGAMQDARGVWRRACGDSWMRNRRDPSRLPTSGEGAAYKPKVKRQRAGRESEGSVVPMTPVPKGRSREGSLLWLWPRLEVSVRAWSQDPTTPPATVTAQAMPSPQRDNSSAACTLWPSASSCVANAYCESVGVTSGGMREDRCQMEACMPRVKTIGKPYAGNPHVRFERGPQETEPERHRA